MVQYSVPNGYGLIGNNPVCQPDSTWSAAPNCMSEYKHFGQIALKNWLILESRHAKVATLLNTKIDNDCL